MKFKTLALFCLGSILCFAPTYGALVTYDVDLSATGFHAFRLFGTVTVDADLDFDAAVQTSNLQLEHDGVAIPLGFSPSTQSGDVNANLDWVVVGNSLFVERINTGDSSYIFQSPLGFETATFRLGSGFIEHSLDYEDFGHEDSGLLKASSGVDTGNGLLIGTAVPEPSSFLMVMIGLTCLAGRRKKN